MRWSKSQLADDSEPVAGDRDSPAVPHPLDEAAPSVKRLLRQKEAALLLGVSVAYLRASECPKVLLPGNGPKGQPSVRYDPDDLERWKESHKTKARAG